jgi:hypothetical protein
MTEAVRVSVPHWGPYIITELSLLSAARKMNSGIAARVAMAYLKMVPKNPGRSSESKILL